MTAPPTSSSGLRGTLCETCRNIRNGVRVCPTISNPSVPSTLPMQLASASNVVVPRGIERRANSPGVSFVYSIWMCASMNVGATNWPCASMISDAAKCPTGVTAAMCRPATTTSRSRISPVCSARTRPPRIMTSAGTVSHSDFAQTHQFVNSRNAVPPNRSVLAHNVGRHSIPLKPHGGDFNHATPQFGL